MTDNIGELKIVSGDNCFYIGADKQSAIAGIVWVQVDEHTIDCIQTYAAPELRGQGVAARLMEAMVNYAREAKLRIVPSCSYIAKVMDKSPEKYADVRAEGGNAAEACGLVFGKH